VLVFKSSSSSKIPKGYNGYTIESQPTDGKWYYEMLIRRTKNVTIPVPIDNVNNPEYPDLRYRVSMMNDKTFRIKINPINMPTAENGLNEIEDQVRWEVPDNLFGNTKDDFGMRLQWGGLKGGKVNDSAGIELNFISTKDRNLVFSEYYIEMGFSLKSKKIFGFGERQGTFELNPGNYSSWANGRDNHFDDGVIGNNSYGDHPFVLAMLNNKTFAGIFFKNSNAKVLEITRFGDQTVLNFRAIGGLLDFFTFTGETAEDVIRLYHQVIGTPTFPPFWALGFQQSSWQYSNITRIDEVLSGYDQSSMPLEGIWLDIEYMDGYKNFLVNNTRFPTLPTTAQALHEKGQKLIVIIDAGLAANDSYTYYKQANEQKLLITSNKTGGNLFGKVWPGKAAFPDFYNPKTTAYWVNALRGLYTLSA